MLRKEDVYRWFRQAIETHVREARRVGVLALLDRLWQGGRGSFFVAPASSKPQYHLARPLGLALHTRGVILCLLHEVDSLFGPNAIPNDWEAPPDESVRDLDAWRESAVIVGLCHDLNKIKLWGKPYYEPNFVLSKDRKSKVQSEATPYNKSKGRTKLGSTDQIMLASDYIDLLPDEVQAIRYTEGMYDRSFMQDLGDDVELLTYLAHFADMKASQIFEWAGDGTTGWSRDLTTWGQYESGYAPEPGVEADPMDQPVELVES